jgi:hypothetical protein
MRANIYGRRMGCFWGVEFKLLSSKCIPEVARHSNKKFGDKKVQFYRGLTFAPSNKNESQFQWSLDELFRGVEFKILSLKFIPEVVRYYQMRLCRIWSRNAENSSALFYVVKRVT